MTLLMDENEVISAVAIRRLGAESGATWERDATLRGRRLPMTDA